MDSMANQSSEMEEQVKIDLNSTEEEFDNIMVEFGRCANTSAGIEGYRSSFDSKVEEHSSCRTQQASAVGLADICTRLQTATDLNKASKCNSNVLTQPIADVQVICKPSPQQQLGPYLDSMRQSFATKHAAWQAQDEACTEAGRAYDNQTAECNSLTASSSALTTQCDELLGTLESFSCSWATGMKGKCSEYESCYSAAETRYNKAVSTAQASLAKMRHSWEAAGKMRCMAEAISTSGSVDAAKMKTCDSSNLTDTSHINVTIAEAPAKRSCPEPVIYPGSSAYEAKVYDSLQEASVKKLVRAPTPCLVPGGTSGGRGPTTTGSGRGGRGPTTTGSGRGGGSGGTRGGTRGGTTVPRAYP